MRSKTSIGSLLLAGAAAYGLYKLSKMTAAERTDLVEKGKRLVSDNLGGLTDMFGGKKASADADVFNEHSYS